MNVVTGAERLAICIPLHAPDIKYLNRCLRSIEAQTRPVDSIHISLSSAGAEDEEAIRTLLSSLTLPPVHIHRHSEILFAGANRNRAASAAIEQGATLLFFFDADDVMHPRRIEILANHFEGDPAVTGILNRYLFGPKDAIDLDLYTIPWRALTGVIHSHAFTVTHVPSLFNAHHLRPELYVGSTVKGIDYVACGSTSVRAAFWKEHPYSETIRIGEDQQFNSQIVDNGGNLAYIPDPLSIYMTGGRCEFDCSSKACDTVDPIQPREASIQLMALEDAQAKLEMLRKLMDLREKAQKALVKIQEVLLLRQSLPDSSGAPR
jgi:cellulose synthase/poly-beta-1,6-N-acetylglucosamine synthase-like glycosyltransferase